MNKPNYLDVKKKNDNTINVINNYSVDSLYKNIGKNKKYFVRTYGCQMNERDSENICALLEIMGYIRTEDYNEADVAILNTCAIRENVHDKVFGFLGRLKHIKMERPLIVGLAGCMSQEEVVVDTITDKYKWLDFVIGTHNIHELPKVIYDSINNDSQQIEVWSKEGDIVEDVPIKRENKYKAWVNIMYGCDKFCTYCIVPYTRGKQRSRLKEDIIKEIITLKEDGYKEITLLGQNVNAYGKDIKNNNYTFSNLLEDISKTGIERVKFVTSHPWDFTDDMIEVIKNNENILPYIHLPFQSGSNRILKLMGRRYTKESYLELVNKLKTNIPNISLTTDIIVGFPNESDEDFNETLDVVNTCKFDLAYTFIYSPREGTPASKMEDNIPLEVKEARLQILNKLINKYANEANEKLLNTSLSVLIETISNKEEYLMGYSETNKVVNVKAPLTYIGKIVNVKIIDSKTWSLIGEINE